MNKYAEMRVKLRNEREVCLEVITELWERALRSVACFQYLNQRVFFEGRDHPGGFSLDFQTGDMIFN